MPGSQSRSLSQLNAALDRIGQAVEIRFATRGEVHAFDLASPRPAQQGAQGLRVVEEAVAIGAEYLTVD